MLRFITGSERLPLAGTEIITVDFPQVLLSPKQTTTAVSLLPQAHTCSNTLELPNYWSALALQGIPQAGLRARIVTLLKDRLVLAAAECEGYGLDDAGEWGGGELPTAQGEEPSH